MHLCAYLNKSGKRVLMPIREDIIITRTTIEQFIIFCERVLTCSPMKDLSFSSKSRKISNAGRSVTATTCTNIVMVIKGAPGIRTTAPEVRSMAR